MRTASFPASPNAITRVLESHTLSTRLHRKLEQLVAGRKVSFNVREASDLRVALKR
jgi:hypothetical protein